MNATSQGKRRKKLVTRPSCISLAHEVKFSTSSAFTTSEPTHGGSQPYFMYSHTMTNTGKFLNYQTFRQQCAFVSEKSYLNCTNTHTKQMVKSVGRIVTMSSSRLNTENMLQRKLRIYFCTIFIHILMYMFLINTYIQKLHIYILYNFHTYTYIQNVICNMLSVFSLEQGRLEEDIVTIRPTNFTSCFVCVFNFSTDEGTLLSKRLII